MARRGRTFVRSAKRTMLWIGQDVGAAVAGADSILLSTLNAAALALRPFTVVRSRHLIIWDTDQQIATEDPIGVLGKIVVTESAAAAGIVSIPTPVQEADADWFIYQPVGLRMKFITGAGVVNPSGMQYVSDSKSMRKVGNDDQLVTIVQNSSTDGAIINIIGRTLIKLH